jgi:hypothetical protein
LIKESWINSILIIKLLKTNDFNGKELVFNQHSMTEMSQSCKRIIDLKVWFKNSNSLNNLDSFIFAKESNRKSIFEINSLINEKIEIEATADGYISDFVLSDYLFCNKCYSKNGYFQKIEHNDNICSFCESDTYIQVKHAISVSNFFFYVKN